VNSKLCGSRKYPYPHHKRSLEILKGRGGGVLKAKILKGMSEPKLEFLEEWGVQTKKTLRGGVWVFSGTTHWTIALQLVY